MNIEFYFDPSCPFSWITSRWLLLVSKNRDLNIEWRPFSLALKNNEISTATDIKLTKHSKDHIASNRVLRAMVAADLEHNVSFVDMYTNIGTAFHILEKDFTDVTIKEMLSSFSIPEGLIKEADNEENDVKLREHIAEATGVVGDDVGVPIIIFVEGNKKLGYFGPVLDALPDETESLRLWDGLSKLANSKHFYEIKRSRSSDPNVFSTARC